MSKPGLAGLKGVLVLRAGAGIRPGGRGTFLCFAKEKYPKERRPPVCDPFAVRRGKPASGWLRGAPWNSLCAGARRSDNHGESVHEACALRRACSPRNRPAAGAASRGVEVQHGPSLRSAPMGAGALRRARQAERSDGPWGCWAAGLPTPSVCAWGAQEAGWRGCTAGHNRASSTDLPRLSERSCAAAQ